jgi:hypothetical protein
MKQTLAIRNKITQRKHIKEIVYVLKNDLKEAQRLIDIYEKTIKTLDFELHDWDNFKETNKEIEQAKEIDRNFIINFVDWVNENSYKYPTKTTTSELLEIYKKKKL